MDILASLYAPAYHSENNLLYLHLCHGVNLSMQHGNAAASVQVYGWFGLILAIVFHRYQEGYRFARLAFDLMERLGLPALVAACIGFVVAVVVPLLIGEVIKRVAFLRFFYFPFPVRKATGEKATT